MAAITGFGLENLLRAVEQGLETGHVTETISLPFDAGKSRAWLFEQGVVLEEVQTETGFDLTLRWTAKQKAQFATL